MHSKAPSSYSPAKFSFCPWERKFQIFYDESMLTFVCVVRVMQKDDRFQIGKMLFTWWLMIDVFAATVGQVVIAMPEATCFFEAMDARLKAASVIRGSCLMKISWLKCFSFTVKA